MAVTQYIGSRYVPLFADPAEWTNDRVYEPLTIVLHQGNSYTSKQYVPVGIDITNEDFWAETGSYNAQVEQYRRDVQTFDTRITSNSEAIEDVNDAIEDARHVFLDNEKIVVFSDSTFQINPDVSTGNPVKSVVEWLSEICDATIDNRGVGGTSTSWLLDLLNNLSPTAIVDATYVIVAYSTNDWQSSRAPFPVTSAQTNCFYYQYKSCIEKILELAPRAQILCVTPAYIHSSQASSSSILNQNNAGSNYKAYCDVIEFVAAEHNCSCIRLDCLLSINETNYRTRMVPSSNDIWVHYAEETTREIAYIIANWPHGVNNSYSENCIDVTPYSWRSYSTEISRSVFLIPTNAFIPSSSLTLNTGQLINNVEYYLTYIGGGNLKVYIDNVVVNDSNEYTIQQLAITGDNASHTITFARRNDSGSWPLVGNLMLSIGRPKITSIVNRHDTIRQYTATTEHGTYKLVDTEGVFSFASVANITNFDSVSLTTQPIDTITEFTGYRGIVCIVGLINNSPNQIIGRLETDGKLYANVSEATTFENVGVIGYGLKA